MNDNGSILLGPLAVDAKPQLRMSIVGEFGSSESLLLAMPWDCIERLHQIGKRSVNSWIGLIGIQNSRELSALSFDFITSNPNTVGYTQKPIARTVVFLPRLTVVV